MSSWLVPSITEHWVHLLPQILPPDRCFWTFFSWKNPLHMQMKKTKRQWVVHGNYCSIVSCQKKSHHIESHTEFFAVLIFLFIYLLHSFFQKPHCSRCSFRTQTCQNIDCNICPKVRQQVARPPCLMHLTFSFS